MRSQSRVIHKSPSCLSAAPVPSLTNAAHKTWGPSIPMSLSTHCCHLVTSLTLHLSCVGGAQGMGKSVTPPPVPGFPKHIRQGFVSSLKTHLNLMHAQKLGIDLRNCKCESLNVSA